MLILLMDAMKYCDGNDRDLIQKVREKSLHFHVYRGVTVGKRRIHTPAGSSRFFFFLFVLVRYSERRVAKTCEPLHTVTASSHFYIFIIIMDETKWYVKRSEGKQCSGNLI